MIGNEFERLRRNILINLGENELILFESNKVNVGFSDNQGGSFLDITSERIKSTLMWGKYYNLLALSNNTYDFRSFTEMELEFEGSVEAVSVMDMTNQNIEYPIIAQTDAIFSATRTTQVFSLPVISDNNLTFGLTMFNETRQHTTIWKIVFK